MVIFVSCEDETLIIEPEVTKSSIYFLLTLEKMVDLYLFIETIQMKLYISVAHTQKSFDDSQNYDFVMIFKL